MDHISSQAAKHQITVQLCLWQQMCIRGYFGVRFHLHMQILHPRLELVGSVHDRNRTVAHFGDGLYGRNFGWVLTSLNTLLVKCNKTKSAIKMKIAIYTWHLLLTCNSWLEWSVFTSTTECKFASVSLCRCSKNLWICPQTYPHSSGLWCFSSYCWLTQNIHIWLEFQCYSDLFQCIFEVCT